MKDLPVQGPVLHATFSLGCNLATSVNFDATRPIQHKMESAPAARSDATCQLEHLDGWQQLCKRVKSHIQLLEDYHNQHGFRYRRQQQALAAADLEAIPYSQLKGTFRCCRQRLTTSKHLLKKWL